MTASHQYLYKPLAWDGSKTAVLLLNSVTQDLSLNLADVPGMKGPCDVRDIWQHKDLGNYANSITVSVDSHDAAFLILSGCSPAPTPPPPSPSKIVNSASGKCADIQGAQYNNEVQIILYHCNGQDNQAWQLQGDAIVNPASGKCLDIYNHAGLPPSDYKDGTKVELYACNGGPNQKWAFKNGALVNPPSGKCLNIYDGSGKLADNALLQLSTCIEGEQAQSWELDSLTVVV